MKNFADSGKLQAGLFNQLIYPNIGAVNDQILTGPAYGVDVSLVKLPGGYAMALTSDPLSWIPTLGLQESAWLSVHLLANDMATTSVPPQFLQLVLNLPEHSTPAEFESYWMHLHRYCSQIGVSITGGHTGKATGQNSTLAGGGTMIATGPAENFLLSKYAKPGDSIIVTKQAAMVATSILALSFPKTVQNQCGQELWQEAAALFYQTSSLETALLATGNEIPPTPAEPLTANPEMSKNAAPRKIGRVLAYTRENLLSGSGNTFHDPPAVTAMHDVTEGGILGAIFEMASAAGCGAMIDIEAIPVGEAQYSVCKLFGIDPLCCVGAGSMIIAVEPAMEEIVLQRLKSKDIQAAVCGKMMPKEVGVKLQYPQDSSFQSMTAPGADPYWNAFFQALKKDWK